ncbi:YetF domain-containing protein [Bacillus sp. EB600]|uniref:YetF domain-containing protein n=1 Tax=Bacillus sp. EB600 TaxID=2806345 RepID=UPI00210DEA5E|nr:YetF domain-containing protein [Bacillus sp. EB600]MCQ6282135.1 DUF421 domain-containing protein [Bacillus sp. EB600]
MLTIDLVLLAKIQLYSPLIRKLVFGIPSVIKKDGKVIMKELKKANITVEDVEMRLRMEKVFSIEDVVLGVLEPSGRLSLTLKPEKIPATKGDIQRLMDMLTEITQHKTEYSVNEIPPLFQEAYQEAKTKDYHQH